MFVQRVGRNRAGRPGAMLRAALRAAGRGWSVVPMRPGEKVPLIPWLEHQTRRAGEGEIRRWFKRWPRANVGVATGEVSDLVVLDVDSGHGGDESLQALSAEHGPLPATVEARTGGGGRHLYFAHPGFGVQNRVGLRKGLDVRGDGGCVVVPPSVHPSGRSYRWREGCSPDDTRPAVLPDWLRELLRHRRGRGHSLEHWRILAARGVEEGERNNAIASLAGHLLWHGVDADVVMELLLAWNRERCRPPLADEEVARTVASITKLHESGDEAGGRVPDSGEASRE